MSEKIPSLEESYEAGFKAAQVIFDRRKDNLNKVMREEIYEAFKYVQMNAEELTDRAIEHRVYQLMNKIKEAI